MRFTSEVYWDKGERILNEDSISLQEVRVKGEKVVFAVVCDGIGGLDYGEVASGFVTERMTEWFYKEALMMLKRHKGRRKIEKAGLRVLYACNEEMVRFGTEMGVKLGTTVTALLCKGRYYYLWHSGDGRAYRIKRKGFKGEIKQLTRDHVFKNGILVRCVGSFEWRRPDVRSGYMIGKNVFLLCSDGFRNRIGEERLKEALHPDLLQTRGQMAMHLREIALYVKQRGEKDNISAIAIGNY